MIFKFICLSFVILSLASVTWAASAPGPNVIDDMINQNSMVATEIQQGNHWWLDLAVQTNGVLSEKGGQLDVGYRMNLFGFDARVSYSAMTYGGISVAPGASQLGQVDTAASDPTSELNRARSSSDPWRYWLVQPGLSVEGRLFAHSAPLLSQRARVGFGYGGFLDLANAIPFAAYIFTAEASLLYQLGISSPWAVTGSLTWNSGILNSQGNVDSSAASGRLPVTWIGASLGLHYSF